MGVFKWLRRERVTITSHDLNPNTTPENGPAVQAASTHMGTIRTEQYKKDLAEFQARRSLGNEPPATPEKKRPARHSIPISCTACTTDHDRTFNYEKKSAAKYKKNSHRRRSASEEGQNGLPNIQFLFQNQVFMPGNIFAGASYSEPPKTKYHYRRRVFKSPDKELTQKHLNFSEDDQADGPLSPPLFFKNNSLPFDVRNFLEASRSIAEEEVDGKVVEEGKKSSQSSSSSPRKEDSGDDKLWEVMSELNHFDKWADEQLYTHIPNNTGRSEDNKSDASAYGLPVVTASSIDVSVDPCKTWSLGKWGVIPVQIKRLADTTLETVRRKENVEVNILRKCRHPNIILLMGLFTDVHSNVHIICERCVDSLYGILHIQGRILSAQTSVQYALDISNALVFLRMRGYIHGGINSAAIMVTSHDAAKLSDLSTCVRPPEKKENLPKIYSPEPQYVNIDDTAGSSTPERQPLISQHPSETYLTNHSVSKPASLYENCENYRWMAPELFVGEEVKLCSKSDVYSLCLVLWESCNASIPWQSLTYEKLKELYTLWNTGMRLPQDGTYPGSLLSLLQTGLTLNRTDRMDLSQLQNTLHNVKRDLDDLEYIVIPARLAKKRTNIASVWDSTPSDSEGQSPFNIKHKAVVHSSGDASSESEKDSNTKSSPLYETIRKSNDAIYAVPDKCFTDQPAANFNKLIDKDFSSACSTPVAKIRARITETPGTLHRSDSTEYCSILSPANHLADESTFERPIAKLSRSFTPKSYKPLHIKVPEYKADPLRSLVKGNSSESSYKFDIKNYSLPSTPIARSNKLRRNAWLSGDLQLGGRFSEKLKQTEKNEGSHPAETKKCKSAPQTPAQSPLSPERNNNNKINNDSRESHTGLKKNDHPQDSSPEAEDFVRDRTSSWSFKSLSDRRSSVKSRIEDDVLANVNVKPLVAIHERWIHEANRKTARCVALMDENSYRSQVPAMKPASHTLQKSPPASARRPGAGGVARGNCHRNGYWEQFCQARDTIARSLTLNRDPEKRRKEFEKGSTVVTQYDTYKVEKVDQATETLSIEEFIRDLIRKEFQHLLQDISDEASSTYSTNKNEEILNRGVSNILNNLKSSDNLDQCDKKDSLKSFSKIKINGNNKPLLQITFNRSGENHLQVLDNCVNVTICDNSAGDRLTDKLADKLTDRLADKLNESFEDTLTPDENNAHSLKRCQAFSALQEARSTEDLYIDDDLSTQMQENFGGKVKLIPLHGSLHEVLCERQDDCCLLKVKQENGCDTIYFRCDNSDTESRDAVDGEETVVYKRSFSLVEERIHYAAKEKHKTPARKVKEKIRPKSEVYIPRISKESRALSNSSPSLVMQDRDEFELNIENVMSYQDSSSEECLKSYSDSDDFERLEQKIEEDLANSTRSSLNCGCLEKISEENLSVVNEEHTE